MMELALIRTLMNKEFYDNNKGIRCPDELFSKDVRKMKQTLDYAMAYDMTVLTPCRTRGSVLYTYTLTTC